MSIKHPDIVSRISNELKLTFRFISAVTKNQRELHLELVNNIILPRLEEILSITVPTLETTECHPTLKSTANLLAAESFDILEKDYILRRFAVKLLGMLFRSRTGESEKRHYFIGLLQKVATSSPHGMREWVDMKEQQTQEAFLKPSSFGDNSISISDCLRREEMNLRFEGMSNLPLQIFLHVSFPSLIDTCYLFTAIHQIELCLGAAFKELPHTHGNVPELTTALSRTAHFYSIDYEEDIDYEMGRTDRLLMTLASILPLARLR